MTNPLDPVLAWYRTANDSLRVTRRVIEKATPKVVTKKHDFHGKDQKDNLDALDRAGGELDRLVVLGLVAVFERALRDHLLTLPVIAPISGDPLRDAVRREILKDVEFWNISVRVIDLFTGVPGPLRGEVKQIIDYRNWVAHGRTATEPPPVATTPAKAHQRLAAFLSQAKSI
jgi:hypothetical protein